MSQMSVPKVSNRALDSEFNTASLSLFSAQINDRFMMIENHVDGQPMNHDIGLLPYWVGSTEGAVCVKAGASGHGFPYRVHVFLDLFRRLAPSLSGLSDAKVRINMH